MYDLATTIIGVTWVMRGKMDDRFEIFTLLFPPPLPLSRQIIIKKQGAVVRGQLAIICNLLMQNEPTNRHENSIIVAMEKVMRLGMVFVFGLSVEDKDLLFGGERGEKEGESVFRFSPYQDKRSPPPQKHQYIHKITHKISPPPSFIQICPKSPGAACMI